MNSPHPLLLEAQGRVCTGPHQSRPLGAKENDPIQPEDVLRCIIEACSHTPSQDHPSKVQMGAFFTAMTIRRTFAGKTGWSEAERRAFSSHRQQLASTLPPELLFLWEPQRGYTSTTTTHETLIPYLQRILSGQHLSYQDTLTALSAIQQPDCHDAFRAAVLIGQRMNIEDEEEVKGYLDTVLPPENIRTLHIPSLTHFGEPYNGAKRYTRPRLFLAAIHAALGRPCILHGVDTMAPKFGITEEQIIHELGGQTHQNMEQTAQWLEDPSIGFAYVSQKTFSPAIYALKETRHHIKKRPPFATTEKAQQLFRSDTFNATVIGFYHSGYEEKLLDLLWERGVDAGLTIKGCEGTAIYSLRSPTPSTPDKKTLNYTAGFRNVAGERHSFSLDADPAQYGLSLPHQPRLEPATAKEAASRCMKALEGEEGYLYNQLVWTAAMTDHLLGFVDNIEQAIEEVKQVLTSGEAKKRLLRYIEATSKLSV